jgi:signal transduction histidine kinase
LHSWRPVLARQIVTAFLVVTLPGALILGGVTLHALGSLRRVSHDLAQINRSLEATYGLRADVIEARRAVTVYALSGDVDRLAHFEAMVRRAQAKLGTCAVGGCHEAAGTPGAAVVAPALAQLLAEARRLRDGDVIAQPRLLETVHRSVAAVDEPLGRMTAALFARVQSLGLEAHAVSRRARLTVGWLMVLVVPVGTAAALLSARRISRPLNAMLLGIRRIMAGDWSQPVAPARGEVGEVARAFNTMVDEVREHREAREEYSRALEQRVRERTEELKRKDHALAQSEKLASLGLLAAGIAHELNNPLTSIVMKANLLAEEVEPGSPLHEELKKIDGDAARCRRIIEDLRTFARRRELCEVPSDVETVVALGLRAAEHELSRRGLAAVTHVPADLPKIVWDPDRMVQVVTNLVVNAAQATPRDGRVSIRCREENQWLALEVSDTGSGIAPEQLSRIFDPFFTTKPDGTGLGLSITHGIVHEHGGRIEVESRTAAEASAAGETGTTVRVLLPYPGATA